MLAPRRFAFRWTRPLELPTPAWLTRLGLIRSLSVCGRDPSQCCRDSDHDPGRRRPRSPNSRRTTAVVMLAEQYDFVIGGDPDRDTIDLAVVDAATGAVRGHCSDRTDAPGYTRLLEWATRQAPGRRVWAL